MSHELRTPLNAILGYAEILEEDLDDPVAREDVGRIQVSASHLLGLIQDILDLTRVESDQLMLDLQDVCLADVVEHAVALVTPQLDANRNQLVRTGQEQVDVLGDPLRLRQVLVNLLSNAATFTTDGEVRVAIAASGDQVTVEVTDTGVGMSPKMLDQVFHRFVQGDDSSTRTHGGAGLGLAISYQMVQSMKGSLSVTSREGVGTTFTVCLPRAANEPRPAAQHAATPP